MKGLIGKLMSNMKRVLIIIVCILLIVSIGALGIILRSEPKEEEYVLRAQISSNATHAYVYEEILFDASGSEGDIVEYLWDFGYEMTATGVNVTKEFDTSRYYNVYLTVTDRDGAQDITMVNISIQNYNRHVETEGMFLDGANRRGPSYDYIDCVIYSGVTNPTVYANWTGVTESAMLYISIWLPDDYYSERHPLVGEDLELRLSFEDVEVDDYSFCNMQIECERGYITDYKLEMDIIY